MRFSLVLLVAALAATIPAEADEARAQVIAPFVDAEAVAVGRLDLTRLDVEKLAGRLVEDQEHAAELARTIAPWISALRKAGAKELYLVATLADLPGTGAFTPSVVVPLADGADAGAIGQLLCGTGAVKGPWTWPTCATLRHAVFAGANEALERVRQLKPVNRPELQAAFSAIGSGTAELVLMPSNDSRRVVEETLPNLPRELGGGPVTVVSHGLLWGAVALDRSPELRLRLIVQGKDADAARSLNQLWTTIAELLRKSPALTRFTGGLATEVDQDRITLSIELNKARDLAAAILKPLRDKSARRECTNRILQIGLALHNYRAAHKTFPPAYSIDKAGKPLLSWRVHILPYLEQEPLYKEFHLDEPWDSPHNKALIERMPATYRCPNQSARSPDRWKTSYLTPRGKSTIFPGPEGIKLQQITDGTSNTILVVDAGDDRAVVWTRPDDWEVEPTFDVKGIFGHHLDGTTFGFADGSVRFIKATVDLNVLKALLTRDGGEVLSADQF